MQIEDFMEVTAEAIERLLEKEFEEHMGFMLLVFPFGGPDGVAHYVSNANREDMIKVLREKADVLEKGADIPRTVGEA